MEKLDIDFIDLMALMEMEYQQFNYLKNIRFDSLISDTALLLPKSEKLKLDHLQLHRRESLHNIEKIRVDIHIFFILRYLYNTLICKSSTINEQKMKALFTKIPKFTAGREINIGIILLL